MRSRLLAAITNEEPSWHFRRRRESAPVCTSSPGLTLLPTLSARSPTRAEPISAETSQAAWAESTGVTASTSREKRDFADMLQTSRNCEES